MIAVVDYGAGNLASLEGALERLELGFVRAGRPADAPAKGPLVLPGVGHFGAAAAKLLETGWWDAIRAAAKDGRPILGICLGLQLLAESSEEAPGVSGLGLLRGEVKRLGPGVKVPHMGWSRVRRAAAHPALDGAQLDGGWLYFVHSFALGATPQTLAAAEHGRPFSAIAGEGRVLGFQPHPEKSGELGLELLRRTLIWMEGECS